MQISIVFGSVQVQGEPYPRVNAEILLPKMAGNLALVVRAQ